MSDLIQKEMKDFTDEELKFFMEKGIDFYGTTKHFHRKIPLKPYCAALLGLHLSLGVENLTKEEEIKFQELYKEIKY
ncbi:hypothetical protein EZS27_017671 [termite gut metagenome]|uniref:Uncharacterized protein n=1 Tax=termite gut metagenome TaxID=433724 RepID=A0A5J4RJ95_9ZZZZ